ncbi:MAG: hypothetical protein Q4C33_03435 [bacterium]|nr:hypothetical protein [bacterium]
MYITETTENVRNLWKQLELQDDLSKLKFLIYIFGLLNNNQINDKNEANPNLIEDEKIKIFNLEMIGLSSNTCTTLLQYFTMLYNNIINTNNAYEDNGNVIGIIYNNNDIKIISLFEQLDFNEKLDVFSEIFIRYDNETFLKENVIVLSVTEYNGFDLAKQIQNLKKYYTLL